MKDKKWRHLWHFLMHIFLSIGMAVALYVLCQVYLINKVQCSSLPQFAGMMYESRVIVVGLIGLQLLTAILIVLKVNVINARIFFRCSMGLVVISFGSFSLLFYSAFTSIFDCGANVPGLSTFRGMPWDFDPNYFT